MRAQGDSDDIQPIMSAEAFIAAKEAQVRREASVPIRTKDIGARGHNQWQKEAATFMRQTSHPYKVLSIERFRHLSLEGEEAYAGAGAREGDVEYRFGYFIVGRNGNRRGRWTWGQYAPFIPAEDVEPLLEKARHEGTLIPA